MNLAEAKKTQQTTVTLNDRTVTLKATPEFYEVLRCNEQYSALIDDGLHTDIVVTNTGIGWLCWSDRCAKLFANELVNLVHVCMQNVTN